MIKALTILLPALWIGVLIGVSFIATPVKFKAQSLTLPVALDVGQTTFAAFSRIERFFAILLIAIYVAMAATIGPLVLVGFITGLVIFQSAWLLPALNRRASFVMAGRAPPPSRIHLTYGAMEGLKLVALTALIVSVMGPSPPLVP